MSGLQPITLTPIGYVRSPIDDREVMPNDGVPAKIELLPEFADGLGDIESNSHLIILGWFHQAHRHRLTVTGKSGRPGREQRGVFGLRSSTRPNPVALNIARLVHRDGTVLSLERLDMIDGTPVVDIKRYSPGWDDVFAARTSRQQRPLPAPDAELVEILLNEVEHFHGAINAGARRAVRLVADLCSRWRIHPTDPALTVTIPMREGAAVDGSIADSVQALTRATFGSGRLHVCGGDGSGVAVARAYAVTATPTATEPPTDYAALAADTADRAVDAGRGGGVGIYMDGQDGGDGWGGGVGLTPCPPSPSQSDREGE